MGSWCVGEWDLCPVDRLALSAQRGTARPHRCRYLPLQPVGKIDKQALKQKITGKSFLIPAFWYQPFDPANLQAQGAPVWRVRFTPPTAGQWQALTLQSPTEASLWLRSDAYSADVAQQAHQQAILKALKSKQKLTTWQYTLRPLHGITVQLSQLSDGAYRVKWFSPQQEPGSIRRPWW